MKSFNLTGTNPDGEVILKIKIKAISSDEAIKIAYRLQDEGKISPLNSQKLSFSIKV